MKKFCIILLIIIAAYIPCINSYGVETPGKTQLFYNGNIFTLEESPLYYDGEYFLPLSDMSSILNISIETYNDSFLTLRYNGKSKDYTIDPGTLAADKMKADHNQPEMIQNKLYLPFSFLKGTFGFVIKYNQSKNIIYIFEKDKIPHNIPSFTNITYDYHIDLPDGVKPDLSESDNNFDDSIMTFLNTNVNFTVTIACDSLNGTALGNMRKYLNDYTSNDDAIFAKFVQYKKSYFNAMQDYYKRNFLYGIDDLGYSESNMKLFGEYTETIMGQPSSVYLYNTISSEEYSIDENTFLSITIPSTSKKKVYTINFSTKTGNLTDECINAINEFIMSFKVQDLDTQASPIKALLDKGAVNAANKGIYPDVKESDIVYTKLINRDTGYEISYPATYIPYKENNIISNLDYKSFKINYNQYFSISSEPVYNKETALFDKLKFVKESIKGTSTFIEEGNINIGGRDFSYLKYRITEPHGSRFVEDYFTLANSRIINLQLDSKFITPSAATHDQFLRIIASLSLTSPSNKVPIIKPYFSKFINQDEGYSLIYPKGWEKTEDETDDINYDSYTIKNPDFSGPLEVKISEGELRENLDYTSVLRYITGSNLPDLNKYFKKYSAPYINKISKPLYVSVNVKDNAIYLNKVINYMDSSSRGKYCYSIDIIRNKKIYSLFITASDYMVSEGKITNQSLAADLEFIASSFGIENTSQYYKRKALNETRNSKVIFIENYIKNNFDKNSKIKSIECLDSTKNLLVTVVSSSGNILYFIKADYAKGTAQVENVFMEKDALREASDKLKGQFKDKYIESIVPNKDQMSLEIKYRDEPLLPVITRKYQVLGRLESGKFVWDIERKDYLIAIKNDCQQYLVNYLSSDAKVYFNPSEDFSAYQEFKKQGKPYYTLVYAEFGKLSGYFLLKINPINDSISLDSYTPAEQIYNKINRLYSSPSNDYSIYNIGQDQSNKFEFQVFLKSKYVSGFKLGKVNITLNRETLEFSIN